MVPTLTGPAAVNVSLVPRGTLTVAIHAKAGSSVLARNPPPRTRRSETLARSIKKGECGSVSNLVRLVDPDEIAAARRSARVNSASDDAPLAEPADGHIVAGDEPESEEDCPAY